MTQEIPQLNFLLAEVEKKINHKLSTPADFEMLAVELEKQLNETISLSTIKRLWGYVSDAPLPRLHTLDVLSKYVGQRDFSAFCDHILNNSEFESSFFTTKYVSSRALKQGQTVSVSWNPDRIVQLEYLGESSFRVVKTINSKLQIGDEFDQSVFMVGYPMFISGIRRCGEITDPFTAGSKSGITDLEVA